MNEPAKLLVIQDTTLHAMSSNPNFLQEFPFLKGLTLVPAVRKGCGSCGGGINNNVRASTFQAAKRTIAGMSGDKKSVLKRMLNAKALRVIFRDGNRTVEYTF